MNRLVALLFAFLILTLSACNSLSYFLPAVVGNDIAYLPKPMHSDSIKTKNYISASYANLSLPYATGELGMGFLNFSRAHTTKKLNIAYGAFGFAGNTYYPTTYNSNTSSDFKNKTFLGGGLRSSISLYDIAGSTEFRMLGWENALSFENGSYADFRKAIKGINTDTVSSTLTTLYTTGISSEIIFHTRRNLNNQFGFRLFYGITPGLRKSLENDPAARFANNGKAFDYSFYFKTRNVFGIFNTGGNRGYSAKFTLGYIF